MSAGAPRKRANEKLPKYFYRDFSRNRTYYWPDRPTGKKLKIGPADMPVSEVWRAAEQINASKKSTGTIGWMIEEYLNSPHFNERLTVKTQSCYRAYAETLLHHRNSSGSALSSCPVDMFTLKSAALYLDTRANRKTGKRAPMIANREMEFLSAVFTWAAQRLHGVDSNPLASLTYNPETPRDRYITDDEYNAVLNLAKHGHGSYVRFAPFLWMIMELEYLCRMRPSEARLITREQVFGMRSEGVFVIRGKGSHNEITRWSPRLEEVALAALERWPEDRFSGAELIRTAAGAPVSYSNYKSCRQRLIKKALELKLIREGFTFHDIKAKGVSDHDTKASGHRSEKMKAVYDRVPGVVKSTR